MQDISKDTLNNIPDEYVDMYVEARGTLQANNNQLWSLLAMGLSPETLEFILEDEGYDFEHKQTLSTEEKDSKLVKYSVYENGEEKILETRKAFGFWRVEDFKEGVSYDN